MPFISPNEAPLLVTHSLPLGPSVTYGMRSRSAAEALAVNRSGGSQIRSMWQSAEMTSYFIGMVLRASLHQHDSRGDDVRLKSPVSEEARSGMEQARPNRPLSDVTVIVFGQIFQGPSASLLLAKAGAFVIKIEPPHGEPGRRRAEPGKRATLPFAMLNQNKHAVTLNLKHERGRELLFRMVERADVLLENFSPGTMDGLGVGWGQLCEINPRLIYATGTGFGISGPDRDNLAMDMTIQAASGIMSVTGFPDGPPVKAGPTLVDFMGGIHLYAGILTALYDRDRSGVGRLVE